MTTSPIHDAPHPPPPYASQCRPAPLRCVWCLPHGCPPNSQPRLSPRGIFALILAIPALSDILYALNSQYTREQLVFEVSLHCWYTPLQYFSSRGVQPVVQRLLETGADPNEISVRDNKHQLAPIVHAITFRSASIVALLLQHGAHVDQLHRDSPHIPLHVAVGPAHAIPPRRLRDPVDHAIHAAEIPRIVELLLDAGANVETLGQTRQTVLQMACATVNASPVVVRSLIAAGADMGCVGRLNYPVMSVAMRGRGAAGIRSGAIHGDDAGIALIHYAVNAGNTEVIQILLDAGVDVEVETRDGMRALDLAVLHKRRDVVELLIRAGADVRARADGSEKPAVLDPMEIIEEAATWEQLKEWLYLRGWRQRGRSRFQWWDQGRDTAKPPSCAGQVSFLKESPKWAG